MKLNGLLVTATLALSAAILATPASADCNRCESNYGHTRGGALIDLNANVGGRRGLVDVDATIGQRGRHGALIDVDANVGGHRGLVDADATVGARGHGRSLADADAHVGNRRRGGLVDLDVRALSGGVGH